MENSQSIYTAKKAAASMVSEVVRISGSVGLHAGKQQILAFFVIEHTCTKLASSMYCCSIIYEIVL